MPLIDLPSLNTPDVLELGRRKRRKKQSLESRQEPERPSLLGKAKDIGLSGLAAVGNLLDLPGSAVRDVMAGKNAVDQLLTPFSADNRTTGRDLLRQAGLAGKKDTLGNWTAGLAADIALDPLTYLTFGGSALSKGGQVAKAAGLLDDATRIASGAAGKAVGKRVAGMTTTLKQLTNVSPDALQAAQRAGKGLGIDLAKEADQPLRGLVGFGLPFQKPVGVIGTGKTAQKVAAGLDVAGAAIKGSAVGRGVRQLFDYSVKGTFEPQAQKLAEKITQVEQPAKTAAFMKAAAYTDSLKGIHKAFKETYGDAIKHRFPDDPIDTKAFELADRIVRYTKETGGDAAGAFQRVTAGLRTAGQPTVAAPSPQMLDEVVKIGKDFGPVMDEAHKAIDDMGGYTGWVGNYFPRHGKAGEEALSTSRIAPTSHESMQGRLPAIRDVPAEIVNHMARNAGTRGKGAAERIQQAYDQFLSPTYGEVRDAAGNIIEAGSKERHAQSLADYLRPKKELKDIFTGRTPDDMLRYMTGAETIRASMKVIHQTVAENLVDGAGVPLNQLFFSAGMHPTKAIAHLAGITGRTVDELGQMAVPADVAKAIVAHTELHSTPAWQKTISDAVDSVNETFKRAVTLPFPSFASRNFTGGQANNLLSGEITNLRDVKEYLSAARQAAKLIRQPDETLMTELLANRVFDPRTLGRGVEASEPVGTMSQRLLEGTQLHSPLKVGESFREAQTRVNEAGSWGQAIDKARTAYGTVEETGARVSQMVEFMNRTSMYLYLKGKGWSPAEAARKVAELQVDYSQLAGFEKSVMRRLAPFYSWQRKMAPVIFQQLLERPGGLQAQTIRAINRARKPGEVTPDYVAETAAIPTEGLPFIAAPPEGTNRYLTGFGLPLETPLQYLGGGARGALLEAASQLNPLLKAPLEWGTGRSFFQREAGGARALEDLDPTLGRLLSNVGIQSGLRTSDRPVHVPRWIESVVSNTPATRFLTTARQLTDPRKDIASRAINFATGARVSDVSPEAQDAVLRDRLNAMLREFPEARQFQSIYVPQDRLQEMSPTRRAMIEELLGVSKTLGERAKIRAAKRKKSGQ